MLLCYPFAAACIDMDAISASATVISRSGSGVSALVLPTSEEWIIVQHTARRIEV